MQQKPQAFVSVSTPAHAVVGAARRGASTRRCVGPTRAARAARLAVFTAARLAAALALGCTASDPVPFAPYPGDQPAVWQSVGTGMTLEHRAAVESARTRVGDALGRADFGARLAVEYAAAVAAARPVDAPTAGPASDDAETVHDPASGGGPDTGRATRSGRPEHPARDSRTHAASASDGGAQGSGGGGTNPSSAAASAGPRPEAGAPSRSSSGRRLVDVNTASSSRLQTLRGIGPAMAARIIEARPFTTVDDLDRVSGIGPATLERLRPYVTVGEIEPPPPP